MSRKVFVSGEMSSDDRLIDVDAECPEVVLLWPWLLTAFDDWGRAEANAKKLRAKVFPIVSEVDVNRVEAALLAFDRVGLLHLYEVDGKRYMFVDPDKWFKWQTHIRKDKRTNDESKIPAPGASAKTRENAREISLSPSPSPSPSPSKESSRGQPPPIDAHPDPELQKIEDAYRKAKGRMGTSPNDFSLIRQARDKWGAVLTLRAVARGAEGKKPGEIKSFAYFLPIIEEIAATAQSPPFGHVVPDKAATDDLLAQRYEKLAKVGFANHDRPETRDSPTEPGG